MLTGDIEKGTVVKMTASVKVTLGPQSLSLCQDPQLCCSGAAAGGAGHGDHSQGGGRGQEEEVGQL